MHSDNIQSSEKAPENFFKELMRFFLLALVIVVPVRVFIAQPFIVQGASMQPTFESGEYLIIDQLSYRFHAPERGDVVVFKYPRDPRQFFIKRIIGLPKETVVVTDEAIHITNAEHPNGFTIDESYISSIESFDSYLKITLAHDEYFVMGDNRPASSDSRVWGALPEKNILGRAFLRVLPLRSFNIFPGTTDILPLEDARK